MTKAKPNRLRGQLTISHPSGGRRDPSPVVTVTLEDKDSMARMVEVEVPLADFARALFGQGWIACHYDLGPAELAGKKYEAKEVEVETICSFSAVWKDPIARENRLALDVKPFEVQGWRAVRPEYDASNHHRTGNWNPVTQTASVRMVFGRYLDTPRSHAEARRRIAAKLRRG